MGSKRYFKPAGTRGKGYLDPGDLENRDQAGYQPEPPAFKQPGFGDSGRDLTNPDRKRVGGDLKFGEL